MRTEAQIRAAIARLPPSEAAIIARERERLLRGETARKRPLGPQAAVGGP